MKYIRVLPALTLALLLSSLSVKAQLGHYIDFWGGPQLTSLANFGDFSSEYQDQSLSRETTLRKAFGMDYVYNFHPYYGIQTGIYYSESGQKYSGHIPWDFNHPVPRVPMNFTSHLYMNYVRVPLAFRFSSDMGSEDRINMSLYMGLQMGFLMKVQEIYTNPAPADTIMAKTSGFDLKKLLNNTDLGLLAGVQVNARLTQHFNVFMGLRFERSLANIEKNSFVLPAGFPAEYAYPLSTKKKGFDNSDRYPTKNDLVNLYIGVAFKLASVKDPGIHPPAGYEPPAE